jgi:hypothetical protein
MKKCLLIGLCMAAGFIPGVLNAAQVKAMTKVDFDAFAIIDQVTKVDDPDLQIRVFETLGGDPAINGNIIYLHITDGNPDGKSLTWDTGLNVNTVASIKPRGKNQIQIQGKEQLLDPETGGAKTIPFSYTLKYSRPSNNLSEVLEVARDPQAKGHK